MRERKLKPGEVEETLRCRRCEWEFKARLWGGRLIPNYCPRCLFGESPLRRSEKDRSASRSAGRIRSAQVADDRRLARETEERRRRDEAEGDKGDQPWGWQEIKRGKKR